MTTNKPLILVLMLLVLVFASCKKWSFNNRIAGTYVGVWSGNQDDHSNITMISETGEVDVADFTQKDKTFTMSSNGFAYQNVLSFHYSKANTFMTSSANGRSYSFEFKAIFEPKEDSLTVELYYNLMGKAITKTFRGKKQ